METRVNVSVEVVRVKEEPVWGQDEMQALDNLTEYDYEKPACIKEEPSISDDADLCSDSTELYADREVEDQFVLGTRPVVLQQQVTSNNYEKPVCIKEEPSISDDADLCSGSTELYADREVEDQLMLGTSPVILQQQVTINEETAFCVKQEPSYTDGPASLVPYDDHAIKDKLKLEPEDENPACVKDEASLDTSCGESGSGQQRSCGESGSGQQRSCGERGSGQQRSCGENGSGQQRSCGESGSGQQRSCGESGVDHQVTTSSEGGAEAEVVYVINASSLASLQKVPVPLLKRQIEKPFSCDICYRKFRYASHMARHKSIHEEIDAMSRPARKRPFFCVICSKPFSQLITFTAHLQKHTTSLPYYCDICEEYFSSHSAFVKHNEIHVDTYGCELCEERFVHKIELLRHRLNHTVSEDNLNKPKRINILRR